MSHTMSQFRGIDEIVGVKITSNESLIKRDACYCKWKRANHQRNTPRIILKNFIVKIFSRICRETYCTNPKLNPKFYGHFQAWIKWNRRKSKREIMEKKKHKKNNNNGKKQVRLYEWWMHMICSISTCDRLLYWKIVMCDINKLTYVIGWVQIPISYDPHRWLDFFPAVKLFFGCVNIFLGLHPISRCGHQMNLLGKTKSRSSHLEFVSKQWEKI